MYRDRFLKSRNQISGLIFCLAVVAGALGGGRPAVAQNPTIFDDEFNGTSLDLSKWQVEPKGYYLQRTEYGLQPAIGTDPDGTSYLRVPLNSYDSDAANTGSMLQGSQVNTRQSFSVGAGLEYEARIRSNNLPAGLVLGFFPYGSAGVWTSTYQQTEIDYEFLTNWGGNSFWSNIWDAYNPLRGGPNSGVQVNDAGLNWNNGSWNDYKIDWYPDHTNWIVNGTIVRTETTVLPGNPMGLTLNLWAPSSAWGSGYSSSLGVASTLAANQNFYYDVDYVRVRPISNTSSAVIGTGTGLTGSYYSNMTMSGTPSTVQLDPRINFNWGGYPLTPALPETVTSAKWTGFIEPEYSGTYTLTTTSDDGSRVLINNQVVVNNWYTQGPTARSGTIALTAGTLYPIEVDYYQDTGGSLMQMTWSCASTPTCIVPQSQLYPAAQPAAPTFSVATGTYSQLQNVTISSSTAGSTIYYTLDGSTPTTASPSLVNGGNVLVKSTGLLSAIAVVSGEVPSTVTYAYYTYANSVKPAVAITVPANNALVTGLTAVSGTASEASGGIGLNYVNLVITRGADGLCWNGTAWVNQQYGLSTNLSNGAWTFQGVLPSGTSLNNGAYTVKAVAYDYAGNVAVATNSVTVNSVVPAAPVFSEPGGNYSGPQTVTITDSSSGGTIYYTTNGSTPTTASPSVTSGSAVAMSQAGTLSAFCVVPGEVPSAVTSASYVYAAMGTGSGLTGAYYANMTMSGTPAATEIDPIINFNWNGGIINPNVPATQTSAKWTGFIEPEFSGSYFFATNSDDGSRVYINGQSVVNNWYDQAPTVRGGSITLSAGQLYPVEVDYYQNTGGAECQFYWTGPSVGTAIVPQSQLYPALTAAPTFSVPAGTYSQFQAVSITSTTPGASIYYTTNGTAPTGASTALANGGAVNVNQAETLSAIAIAPSQSPSAVSTAAYAYANSVKPVVALTAPANGAALQALASVSGTASEAATGIGLSKVQVVITSAATGMKWNGTGWVSSGAALPTTLANGAWTCNGPLPSGSNLPDGSYTIEAVASDYVNNTATASATVIIDTLSPSVAITLPTNGSTLSTWSQVTGTAADRGNGSGLSHVDLVITRASDGTEWNGWVWLTTPTGVPTTLSGGTFSAVNTTVPGIPAASKLTAGSYTVKAVAYDNAGNANASSVSITISESGVVESAFVVKSAQSS